MKIDIVFQLFLAILLGGLIGLERERKRKSAGFQTYSMVSFGSCLFTLIVFLFFDRVGGSVTLDPSRVIQAVAAGIGFIGAGVIIFREDRVEGLTTAAGLWTTAGVGVAVGANFYSLAIVSTLLVIIILAGFGLLEEKIINKQPGKK
jgi:putative Mg2+ transporter-C (MgtC) family protein